MTRLIGAAVSLSYFLLQTGQIQSQVTRLGDSNIYFELPGSKWKLATKIAVPPQPTYIYQREPTGGDNAKATLFFMQEWITKKITVSQYFEQKQNLLNVQNLQMLSSGTAGRNLIGLPKAILGRGLLKGETVYIAVDLTDAIGTVILCSVKEKSFHNYDTEFKSILRSLGHGKTTGQSREVASEKPTSQTPSTASVTKNTATTTEKPRIDVCSYFPIVTGMKYQYLRSDMAGEHNIIEEYGMAKDKVISTGKSIKGFRVRTTVAARDRSLIYYYCENGSMKMLAEMQKFNTHISKYVEDYSLFPSDYNKPDYQKTPIWETEKTGTGIFLNFTELKAGNVGTKWMDVQVINDKPVIISSEIVATDLSITVQGKTYSPVLRVDRTVVIRDNGQDMPLNSQEIYYAKAIGKIKVIENGNDVLLGSFTTTQELTSYSIPGR